MQKRALIYVGGYAGLGVLMTAVSAQAGTKGGLYDMNVMINDSHPFASPSLGLAPTTMPPARTMTPLAPPSPTLRYTPPPRPPHSGVKSAQADKNFGSMSYRAFGEDTNSGWFNNFYMSFGGGLNLPNDLDGSTATGGASYSIESDPGFVVQGAMGKHLGPDFRIEAEAAYRMADFDQATAAGTTSATPNGDTKIATGIVNIYYDLRFGDFTTSFGGGAGVAQIKTTALTVGGLSIVERDATEFAYQAIIGVTYALSRDWSIGLDGRYLGTSDEDVSATALTLNVRYNL